MTRILLPLVAMAGLGLAVLSCQPEYHEGCEYHSDCGDGELCNDDSECEEVECTSSDDCASGKYCGSRFECLDGCEGDSDCLAGETCTDQHECQAYGCRTTELDCMYGEKCNESTGECDDALGENCSTCNILNFGSDCGGPSECWWMYDGGDCNNANDCEPGYACDDLDLDGRKECHRSFCLETCNPNAEEPCPRGFQCGDVTGTGDYYCFADCEFMVDNGYL